jgi:hypothetical protein
MKEKERKMSVPFSSSFVLCIKKKLNLKKNKQKKTFGIFFFSHHFFYLNIFYKINIEFFFLKELNEGYKIHLLFGWLW